MNRLLLFAAQVGEPITRDGARDAARRELSRPIYGRAEPGLVERVFAWIGDRLDELLSRAIRITPGGVPSVVLVLVVVAVLGFALYRGLGPATLRDQLSDRRRGAPELTADDYRAEAEALAEAARHKEAVRARFRAIVRELEQRAVVDPRPGRTADEIVAEAAAVVPELRAELTRAARVFDDVWYGGRPAGPTESDELAAIDADLRDRRLTPVETRP